jgi:acetolactate synthase-1/2/3 large subunit
MAVFAASAYARATDNVGVVLVTSGPGVTNALTGLASAFCDSMPVLLLAGEVPRSQFGRGALQEGSAYSLDVRSMVGPITKAAFELTNAQSAASLMGKAIATAKSGRKGPVFVSLPLDVTRQIVDPPRIGAHVSAQFVVEATLLDEVADLLANAERPLILAGSGARWGRGPEQLRRLAERGGIPVCTTPKAKGVFPESHPLALGIYGHGGHHSAQRYLAAGVDVLFAIGTGFGEAATNTWNEQIKASKAFIQLDVDAYQIGRNYRADIGLVGPAEVVVRQLLERVPKVRRLSQVRGLERIEDSAAEEGRISASMAIRELQAALPEDAIYTVDIGDHMLFALHYLQLDRPDAFYFAGGLGSMGSGFGAALGVKLGLPDRPVVAICGDGTISMCGTELLTARQVGMPVVYAVLNDGSYGMVDHGFKNAYGRSRGFPLPMDLPQLAEGLGGRAITIRRPGEIGALDWRSLLHGDRPLVLNILTGPMSFGAFKDRIVTPATGALA